MRQERSHVHYLPQKDGYYTPKSPLKMRLEVRVPSISLLLLLLYLCASKWDRESIAVFPFTLRNAYKDFLGMRSTRTGEWVVAITCVSSLARACNSEAIRSRRCGCMPVSGSSIPIMDCASFIIAQASNPKMRRVPSENAPT